MLKIAYSGLLNAQIAHSLSDLDKLMEALFFTAAAPRLRIRLALHGALQVAGRRIAGASFGTGRRRGRLVGWATSPARREFIQSVGRILARFR